MKKRKGGKKKTNSSNRNFKHKKSRFFSLFNNKVLIAVAIVAFLVFAFLLGFVNKGNVTGKVQFKLTENSNFISDFFNNWQKGDLDIIVAKYLLWATLLLFITSVLSFIGFPEKGFLQFLLGLVSSFLAVAYLTPAEIYTVLISWDTLGLTLGVVIPFLIMIFTSSMLLSPTKIKHLNVGRVVATIVLWLVWTCFLIYRLVNELIALHWDFVKFAEGGRIVFLVVLGLSILVLLLWKNLLKIIGDIGIEIRRMKSAFTREEAKESVITSHEIETVLNRAGG